MSWKRPVSVVVLAILAALPVSGAVCAMLCDSTAKATASHHGSGKNCEEPARPSTDAQIRGGSEHDCSNHDAAVRQATTTAAERAAAAASASLALATVQATVKVLPAFPTAFAESAPPGTAPPTTTPLVLRV